MTESSTAICRHEGCGKRFALSRYGNRTHTSERTRKGRHLFCSNGCRVAHHRRIAALRGGVTAPAIRDGVDGVTAPGGTIPKGGVTDLKITQQNQGPLAPKITTESRTGARPYRGGIVGPRAVIQAAVIDVRAWTEVISSDGVKSYVSRLGRRALVEEAA